MFREDLQNGHQDENLNNSNNDTSSDDDNEMSTISFKDVEDALQKFSGEPFEDIEEWITEFEATAVTCKWSPVQQYLFARKLLRGESLMAVKANSKIVSYETLLVHLRKEHKDDTSDADIHERLLSRRKTNNETYKIDERSLCKYVVNGLTDNPRDKITLFDQQILMS